jgi:predicted ATPase
MRTKRLRIFAGPNGSGKSVLYEYLLSQQYFNNYFYVNADVITKGLVNGFSFSNWPISISESDFFYCLNKSSFKNLFSVSEVIQ